MVGKGTPALNMAVLGIYVKFPGCATLKTYISFEHYSLEVRRLTFRSLFSGDMLIFGGV